MKQLFAATAIEVANQERESACSFIEEIHQDWLNAFDAVPDPIFMHDSRLCITRANKAYAKKAGLTFNALIGRPYWEVFPKLDGPLPSCADACKAPLSAYIHEEELQLESGEIYLSRASHVFGSDSEYMHSIHILQDITERKRIEQTLKDSERLFRNVVETVPDVLYQSSLPDYVITYISPSISDLLGFSPEEWVKDKQLWIKQLHSEDCARILRQTEAAIEQKATKIQHEYRMWHKNGKDLLWLQNHVTIVYDSHGQATGIVGSLNDITDLKRVQNDLQKTSRTLKTLSRCNNTLVHAADEPALLHEMCNIIVEIGGYQGAWVGYAHHDKAKTLKPMAQAGLIAGYIEALNPTWANKDFGTSPSGKSVRTGKKQIIRQLQALRNAEDAVWRLADAALGVNSILSLPLTDDGKILGNLSIYSVEPEAFDKQEVATLQELAEDLAFGISTLRTRAERKKYLEEQHQYLDKIRKTLEATIQAVVATVEMRDPYTAGHERRVADLAAAIAREMGLPDHQTEGVRVAASVHDLGKIKIPAEILSNPSRLNEIEYNFIKTHPLMGYNILKDIDFPWPIAEIVLQHHERLDGSGYPNRSKGKHILLEARIVAVADTVEAMASHRPYRASLGIEAALDEIAAGSGKRYDHQAVDACTNLFRTGYSFI